jgi:hypothetical protein
MVRQARLQFSSETSSVFGFIVSSSWLSVHYLNKVNAFDNVTGKVFSPHPRSLRNLGSFPGISKNKFLSTICSLALLYTKRLSQWIARRIFLN